MKRIKLFMAACALMFGVTGMVPVLASAATPQSTVCSTLGAGTNCKQNTDNSVSLSKVITVVIDILSIVVGITAVIMIIIGGLRYITSAGDSNGATSARNTVLYAIVGLVIVAMAQFIVQFVVNKL